MNRFSLSCPSSRPGRRLLVAGLLLLLFPAACASSEVSESLPGYEQGPPVAGGRSLAGNYLAGRHAQVAGDVTKAAEYLGQALKRDPDRPDLLRRNFVLLAAEGRIKEARALAPRVIALDEQDAPVAHLLLAAVDIKARRFAEADKRLRKASTRALNRFMVPLLRAWALVGLGKYPDEALAALKPLSESAGAKALHDLHAALINELANRDEEAERLFRATVDSPGGLTLRIVTLFGGFYERTGRPEKARELYDTFLKERPGSRILDTALTRLEAGDIPPPTVDSAEAGAAEAFFGVASSLRQQRAGETALLFGRIALYLKPDFPSLQLLIADILDSENRRENANKIYAKISKASPFYWAAQLRIANNLDRLERTDEAIRRLRAMAQNTPELVDPLVELGDIFRRRERYQEAVAAYDRAFARIKKLKKEHWSLLYARGIAYERNNEWPLAEKDFLKALEFEPNQPYVLNYLGYSWIDKDKHLARATDMIKKAAGLRPDDGYIVDSLGWAYYRRGKYGDAVRELERAVELRPEDPVINDHLGDAYWKVGRRAEARFQWRRAINFKPEEADVLEAIKRKLKHGLSKDQSTGRDG